jgi:hypothetical protein
MEATTPTITLDTIKIEPFLAKTLGPKIFFDVSQKSVQMHGWWLDN